MKTVNRILGAVNDPDWKYPLAIGSVAILFSVGSQLSAADQNSIVIPFVAGAIVGAVLWNDSTDMKTLGWRTGLIAGGAVIIGALRFSLQIPEIEHTFVSLIFGSGAVVLVSALYILIFGIVGAIGAVVGGMLGKRFQRGHVSDDFA